MSDKADLKVMESPGPCVDPEVLQYQILVSNGGALTYIYLGTTTTQLYFAPPVAVETGIPMAKSNLSTIFLLRSLEEKNVHGDDLWEIRSNVTPYVYARVDERDGHYDIIMDKPVEQELPFYFRSKRNDPMSGSEPIPENAYMSICFDDPVTEEQLFWHPSGVNSKEEAPDRIVTGTKMLSGGPKEMAKFQFVPIVLELPLVVAEENPKAASKRSGIGCVLL